MQAFFGRGDTSNPPSERTALLGKLGGNPFHLAQEAPVIGYDPEQLTNWRAIISLQGTIFLQPAVLYIIFAQFAAASAVAALLYFFASNPEDYKADAMKDVVKTVAVSIAFLLGLFLSSCINRWWDTITSLESLFGTIKRLNMTAINLEIPPASRDILCRRCVLSCYLLQVEQTENHAKIAGRQSTEETKKHWEEIFDLWEREGKMDEYERILLTKVPQQQRSFFAWSLVSKELLAHRHHANSGNYDYVMAYDRMCDLVQAGVASVSAVRTAAAFQMPYVYVHLLAFMIHFVNVLTAIGTGVRVGLVLGVAHKKHTAVDHNELVSALAFLIVQAFIYQAFLTIGAALSFPITGSAYRVPLKSMCQSLESQLLLMNYLADHFDTPAKDLKLPGEEVEEEGEDFGV